MYYTYVIKSKKDQKWYTGSTNDLRKRFKDHNDGKVFSTKNRGPFQLIYYEACLNEQDARQREKYLKSGLGKRYLKQRLNRFLSQTGFTRIELAIVISIYLLLFVFVIIARQTTRAEARDVQRLSDIRQLSAMIEAQYVDTPNESLSGCESAYSLTTACAGPGRVSQFSNIKDPLAQSSKPCLGRAGGGVLQDACGYSISKSNGVKGATTDNYQLCFYIERGGKVKGFTKGLYHIETGGILKQGCN